MNMQITDRAVYLTGELKDNWEKERVKEESAKEAIEEKDGEKEKEGDKKDEEEENKEMLDEEVPNHIQIAELQPEGSTEPPQDSVALIRGLVTEITEVEVLISPCPNNDSTPWDTRYYDNCRS